MDKQQEPKRARPRTKQVVFSLLMLIGLVVIVSRGTLAVFTSQATNTGNSFTSGGISLGVSPATALVTYSSMMPGDTVTSALQVTNSASATLRYAISSTATNTDAKGLKDQLTLTIKTVDVTTPQVPCDNFDGTQIYTGDLDSSAGKLVGDAAQGANSGDRTLAGSASEYLCFRVNLALATANTFSNATTTATFTFDAEQTANNP